MSDGIEVTVRDLANGDEDSVVIDPGNYVCICAEPLVIASEVRHANGTVILTMKRRPAGEDDR